MTLPVWTKKQCDRFLLFALAVVLLLTLALFTLWNSLMDRYQEAAEEARHRTAHYLRVAERKETAQTELNSSKLQALIKQNYLTGEAPGVAFADLQQQIKEIISDAGGLALSTQLLQEPQDQASSAEKITVRVRMQGDSYVLQRLVQALEVRKPLLFFDELSISAPGRVKKNQAEQLDIRFDIYGYFWKETS
jgi:ABC-type nickel/cobalt efflux system permease component RcnA